MQRKNRHHNRHHQRHKKSHAKKAVTSTQLINTSLAKPAEQDEAEDVQVAGIQRGFSIRPNLIALPAFISQLSYACADTVRTYFLSNNTNYRIDIDSELPEFENALKSLVNDSVCGHIRTNLTSIAYDYLSIQKWTEVEDRGRMDSIEKFVAEFLRGVNDVAQEELEPCIKFLLDEAYKALEDRQKQFDHKASIVFGVLLGSITGATLLGFGAFMLYRRWQRTHAAAASPAEANEAGAASSSSNRSGNEKELLLSKKNIFTIKEELKKLTLAERLKVIGVDLNKYPEAKRFICPVTQEVMEDPVITDDGNTYEKATLMEQKQLNGTCPLDRSKQIKVMIPNHNLRAQIIEFVEAREAEAKNKIVQLPEKQRGLRRSY